MTLIQITSSSKLGVMRSVFITCLVRCYTFFAELVSIHLKEFQLIDFFPNQHKKCSLATGLKKRPWQNNLFNKPTHEKNLD